MTDSRVILITGGIGSGKTSSLMGVRRWAEESSLGTAGIISPRIFRGDQLIGYDALNCSTGESFPIARIPEVAEGDDWIGFQGLGYLFSTAGFDRANAHLEEAAGRMRETSIVMVDEIGRLEMRGGGLRPGLEAVLDSVRGGRGHLLVSCRLQSLAMVREMVLELGLEFRAWTPDEGRDLCEMLSEA